MRSKKNKSFKILLAFGMSLIIGYSAYSQQSSDSKNVKSPGNKLNTKVQIGIVHNSDSLATIIETKKRIRNRQDTSGIQNRYFDESQMIGGLVIDHTQSKWGRDFVDLFNKNFNPPEQLNNYTVVIEEKPLPQFGTLILMKVNGNYVYQRFIQPRYQTIKLNAEQASAIALQYLANYQQIQKDLQGEDLKGTGIY